MEGSCKEVKNPNCWGGRWCRPLAILCRNALAVSFLLFSNLISQTFDVLIVEKPEYLSVYDSFQRSLTSRRASALRPFVPIKILKTHDLLGDGLTPCMKVNIEGDDYYILRSDNGNLSGWRDLGEVKTFKQRKFIDDTIAVTISGRLQFQPVIGNAPLTLKNGDHCVRYFDNDGAVYVKKLELHPSFGWIKLSEAQEGTLWKTVRSMPAATILSQPTRDRLKEKIEKMNHTFSEVFSLLSKETGKRLAVPQWHIDSSATTMTCILLPAASAGPYRQSIDALTATLQAYLLGTEYDAMPEHNRIEIKRR